ncbi:MAG: methionine adenosyltransferase, partial [Staphylothermus sp.]|nr:methionine adenosyltransferase [Staphylothermus sp.]
SKEYKKKNPAVGEDIKVMGLRQDKKIVLTIAAAIIDQLVLDIDEYLNIKEQIKNDVLDLASKIANDYTVDVYVNTADMPEKKVVYLTVTGTSAEHGDDGATGRGNRANGLIPPMRPISLEATAGKNPVNHVGKIYNVVARRIAEKVYAEIDGFKDVYVELLSQIGKPIDQPLVASIKIIPDEYGKELPTHVVEEIKTIANEELTNITKITYEILEGKEMLY